MTTFSLCLGHLKGRTGAITLIFGSKKAAQWPPPPTHTHTHTHALILLQRLVEYFSILEPEKPISTGPIYLRDSFQNDALIAVQCSK